MNSTANDQGRGIVTHSFRKNLLITSIVAGVSCTGGAFAADTTGGPVIDTIVVTALKREQNIQDVPISMTSLSGDSIRELDTRDFRSLQNYIPNLLVQATPGPNQFFIRGFGSPSANDSFEQSVSVYVDGVYGARNRQFMTPFLDVERIEVMRGPQGALLGKNTAAGAISIVTGKPTDTFEGSATASYNLTRKGADVYGYVSGPLTDKLSARIAAKSVDIGGYIKNNATGVSDPNYVSRQVRPTFTLKASDTVDLTAKFDYADVNLVGVPTVQVPTTVLTLRTDKTESPPFGQQELDRTVSYNTSLNTNIGIGDHTLTSITAYSAYKNKYFSGAGAGNPETFLVGFRSKFHQFSEEVRLLSPSNQTFEYIVGAYYDKAYFQTENASRYNILGGAVNGQVTTHYFQNSHSYSAFGQGTYNATDALRLLVSARYTSSKKDARFNETTDFGVPLATAPNLSDAQTNNNFDPSATLQYDVAPDVMVYGTYGRGSKGGGFVSNTRTVRPGQFRYGPEKADNYELGLKSKLFDGSVLANVTLYMTKFKDLQVSTFDSTQVTFITKNAARATSKGVEYELTWALTDGIKIGGSGAYLHGKYDDFPGAACVIGAPTTCVAATNNLKGTTILGASKWQGSFNFDATQPISDSLQLRLMGVLYFRSAYFVSGDQSPTYGYQPGYSKFDLRAELGDRNDRWSLAIVGKNLGNKVTKSFGYQWPFTTPPTGVVSIEETRTVVIEAHARF